MIILAFLISFCIVDVAAIDSRFAALSAFLVIVRSLARHVFIMAISEQMHMFCWDHLAFRSHASMIGAFPQSIVAHAFVAFNPFFISELTRGIVVALFSLRVIVFSSARRDVVVAFSDAFPVSNEMAWRRRVVTGVPASFGLRVVKTSSALLSFIVAAFISFHEPRNH